MSTAKQIRFLPYRDRRIAYALSGDGPPLVAAAWWVSHLELDWQDAGFRQFWDTLGDGYTVARYDRLGVGMSDREGLDAQPTADDEVALLRTVLDELELERVVLLGGCCGGCTAISFAARFPERVEQLLLYGAYADGAAISSRQVREAIVATVRSHWGLGSRVLADIFLGKGDVCGNRHTSPYVSRRTMLRSPEVELLAWAVLDDGDRGLMMAVAG